MELIEGVYPKFDREDYLEAMISPVFFGSAVNNFGVRELLNGFIEIAPTPCGRDTDLRTIHPDDKNFSGFVFNRFKLTQKQKLIIEKQKGEVDKAYEQLHKKNEEITDSIIYASRIQRALITSEKYFEKELSKN